MKRRFFSDYKKKRTLTSNVFQFLKNECCQAFGICSNVVKEGFTVQNDLPEFMVCSVFISYNEPKMNNIKTKVLH